MKRFRLGIVARLKQGDLLEALSKRGWNQTQAATFLGITPSTFGSWINMTDVPQTFTAEMTLKLFELTGKTPEQLFPGFIRSEEFRSLDKTRRVVRDVNPEQLVTGKMLAMLPAPASDRPDSQFESAELEDKIFNVLESLTPCEREIIESLIMEEQPIQNVASDMQMSAPLVKMIRDRGLRKLRRPELALQLRDCM